MDFSLCNFVDWIIYLFQDWFQLILDLVSICRVGSRDRSDPSALEGLPMEVELRQLPNQLKYNTERLVQIIPYLQHKQKSQLTSPALLLKQPSGTLGTTEHQGLLLFLSP